MSRRATLAAAAIAVMALAISASATAQTGDGDSQRWGAAIEEARIQAEVLAFAGTVVVEWRDRTGRHRSELDVRHGGGMTTIDAERTVLADGSARMVETGKTWTVLARGNLTVQPELASEKYDVRESRGPRVAGRPTVLYEAGIDGVVVARMYVDEETGIVLRRQTLDADGAVVRSVGFTTFTLQSSRATESSTVPHATGAPDSVGDLDAPLRDPGEAGAGFHLVGKWEHADDVAQLYYSDGVLGVSVFEQVGSVDWDDLPAGDAIEVDGHDARRYALPIGEVLVFERNDVVYTLVGDTPSAELAAVAADVSAPDDGAVQRITRLVLAPLRW